MTPLEVIGEELCAPVNADMVLDELAIDSLEYIEMIHQLEKVFKIRIEEKDLEDVNTLGELCRLCDDLRRQKDWNDHRQDHLSS